jgi:hypothetical protein
MVARGDILGVMALVLNMLAGVAVMGGMMLLMLGKGHNIYGWGDGRGIGLLFACIGFSGMAAAVLLSVVARRRSVV